MIPSEGGGSPITTLKITKLTTGGDGTFDFTVTGPSSYTPSISTSGGTGFDEQTIASGTYSIQETIPFSWDLITATCNDGSSSFSVDTVSGIVIDPGDTIECIFENEQLPQGTLKITKLTTGGDGTFDFTVTGPSSYTPSISTSGGDGTDEVEAVFAISSFLDSGGDGQIFINPDPVSEIGESGALGNSITLSGEKITRLVTLGSWASTTGTITAYIWSGITQNVTAEGSETVVAQSDTWDFAAQGEEFPPNFEQMVFNFSNPVSLTGDYVIGYKWSNIDEEGNSIGSRDSLVGGNSIFRSDGCTITEIGTSDTWSSCHTELSEKIRNLSMDITIEKITTSIDAGTGIQSSNLVVYHTFDSDEIEDDVGLNAGTFGGNANAYFLTDNESDQYTGDWYLSNFLLNPGVLNEAHINKFNSSMTDDGAVVQLGSLVNRGQWNFLHDDITNEYSMSFWLNGDFDEALPIPVINTFSDYFQSNGFALGFDGGIPYITISQDDFDEASSVPFETAQFSELSLPDDGNFHLVTLSVEKSNVTSTAKACIDLLCETIDRDDSFSSSSIAERPLTIGEDHDERSTPANYNGGRSYAEFQMDDLCIWEGVVLSSSERNTLYNSGNGQPCATIVQGSGSGIDGPTNVVSGTYSIQETVPTNWNLLIATCNDGSSSFSIDTVSGIPIDFGDNIECTFENEFSTAGSDVDGDGINDEIDLLPLVFSDTFDDLLLGGTSDGVIIDRADQTLTISEESNPDGVRARADISGGLTPAEIEFCNGASFIMFNSGDETVVTCSSVKVTVISGQPTITFFSQDNTEATTIMTQGNSITFDQTDFSFTTPATNTETVIVSVNGQDTSIPPDSTVLIPLNESPDCASATPSQSVLWPANHKFQDIVINGIIDSDGDPITINIDGITQDEPTPGPGSKHSPDGDGVGTNIAKIRSERDGSGDGRVYEIIFTAFDGNGGECSSSVLVQVPHDQSGEPAIDSGQNYDSTVE